MKSKHYIDKRKRSDFHLWFCQKIFCPIFGHKFEWWQLIERSKCARCLTSNSGDNKSLEIFDKFMHLRQERIYRKLQIPYWKLAGMKLSPEEIEQEKYMQAKGLDYYDVQRIRDIEHGAKYKKDLSGLQKRHLKPEKTDYRRTK